SVIQQVANRDVLAIRGKFWKKLRQLVVVLQRAIVRKQHDRHGGELLRKGRETKISSRVDFRFGAQVAHSVAVLENGLGILAHQNGDTWIICRGHRRENRADSFFHRRSGRLSLQLTGSNESDESENTSDENSSHRTSWSRPKNTTCSFLISPIRR